MLAEEYCVSCERLWHEGEAMMMRREALLARGGAGNRRSAGPPTLCLGRLAELRRRPPPVVEFGGEEIRILLMGEGTSLAHATTCPHRLGLLGGAEPEKASCAARGMVIAVMCGPARALMGAAINWRGRR